MIQPESVTAFDVETKGNQPMYGLQPCRARTGDAWLTTCAVADWEDGEIVTDALVRPTVDDLSAWLEKMIAQNQYVVCWNAPFDVAWLIALGLKELVYKVKWLDGMLLYRHMINAPKFRAEGRTPLGLKQAITVFVPEAEGYGDDIDFDDESPEAIAKLLTYNQLDSRYTLWLTCKFLHELPVEVVRCALIEARTIPLAAETIVEGVAVDTERAKALAETLLETKRLKFMQLKMRFPDDIEETVLASPTQLRELLFKKWGLPFVHLTDTGEWSTDKEALLTLALEDDRAQMVYDYREASNNYTKFAQGTVNSEAYNGDGCSRPQFRIFGTYTGRGTYSSKTGKGKSEVPTGIAIHQWKRDPDFRKLIVAPEGYDLLEFDFAGQEFRWMAVESGDPTMLGLCAPGEDAHAFMAAKIVGQQYETLRDLNANGDKQAKAHRQLGKVANLSLQYRTYPRTLVKVAAIQHKVKITFEEAKTIHATYLTTYRAVRPYWKRQITMARQQGWVETKAGRRVYLGHPDTWKWIDDTGKLVDWTWGHESTAINFPIQGIGADQKYLALLVLRDYLPKIDGRFLMELHDGLFVLTPKHQTQRALVEIKHLLSNLPYKRAWGVDLPIQFPVDAKVGPSWGELKEVH